MDENVGFVQLITQAQLGDQQSMNRLAEAAQERVSAYIYRLTLNHDLTQDLLQETLLKMVESINELQRPDRFWHWLFRTALGVVQHYYRDRQRERTVAISALSKERLSKYLSEDLDDGLDRLMRRELSEAIVQAIARLRLTYRSVLMLRCFEQMSYAEIAGLIGCKELRARVLFFRAKHSLKRQLARQGFSKSFLLTALGVFGLITAPAKGASAGTVSAASLDVGLVATVLGAAGTRLGMAIATAIAGVTLSLTVEKFIYFFLFFCFAVVCFLVAIYREE
jgi:RNA polymerase sigma-70 factor (ECF subfamily)